MNESYMFSSHVTNLESCKKLAVCQVTNNAMTLSPWMDQEKRMPSTTTGECCDYFFILQSSS
jgi:hypothetical protein